MNLSFTPEEEAFREEVRAFLRDALPPALAEKTRRGEALTKAEQERWHAILNERGWLASTWPVEHGGPGWTPVQRHIFDEETARLDAPRVVPFGVQMLGPVLMRFGTEAQKAHYLPRILDGTDWWCQGYSEPGSGSDLASLRTSATRDGGEWVVNGQKTWTTLAQHADHIFCLVRTRRDGKPQEGISFLLIPMDRPGVTVRPIRLIEGGHEVNEVFLDDVRVPAGNLVGEENEGWTIAKFLLAHERTNIAGTGFSIRAFERLSEMARRPREDGSRQIDDPLFAARLAEIEVELEALRLTNLRMLAGGAEMEAAAMLKVRGTEVRQSIDDLTRRAIGPEAAAMPGALEGNLADEMGGAAARYFNNRKISIYGGSNEIQKNIVAKMMGL